MALLGVACANWPPFAPVRLSPPHILMSREGLIMNDKKLRRLYREEHLQVRRRGGREACFGHTALDDDPAGA
jgi:hypothetical protein